MTSVVTTVAWLVFAAAGVAGLRLQYQQAQASALDKPPITAEKFDVHLVGASANQASKTLPAQPPDQANDPAPPPMPAIPAVVDPSPAIPFAVAIESKAKPVTDVSKAVPLPAKIDVVQHLTFGVGSGDQPAPEYPREARIARQQGSVKVRFVVNDSGEVTDVEAVSPCPYALLNQAAVRVVREMWHFPAGKPHIYDVTFQFELHQK